MTYAHMQLVFVLLPYYTHCCMYEFNKQITSHVMFVLLTYCHVLSCNLVGCSRILHSKLLMFYF